MVSADTIEVLLGAASIFIAGLMKVAKGDKEQNSAQFLWGIVFALVVGWGLDRILAVLTDHQVPLGRWWWAFAFCGIAFIAGFCSWYILKLNIFTFVIGFFVFIFGLARMNYYAIDDAGDTLFPFHITVGHPLYSWVHVLMAMIIACPFSSWVGAQAGVGLSFVIARRREARSAPESPSQPQLELPPQSSNASEPITKTGTDDPPPSAPTPSTPAPPAPAPALSQQPNAVPGRPAGPRSDARLLLDAGLTGDMVVKAVQHGQTTD